jgi:hypothetical protein
MGLTTDTIKKGITDAAGAVKHATEQGKDAARRVVDQGRAVATPGRGDSKGHARSGCREEQGGLAGPATPRGPAGPSHGDLPQRDESLSTRESAQ